MDLAAFHERFRFEEWFDTWMLELASPIAEGETWPPSTRRLISEALSDASAELFLNPLMASHLRRFGSKLAKESGSDRVFWVRCEWAKVDISFGLAEPFSLSVDGWNQAWQNGTTGDLGQCEVKVCYTHLHAGRIKTLAGQLAERRERDRSPAAPGSEGLRYFGLVWLFEHSGTSTLASLGSALEHQAELEGLEVLRPFERNVNEVVLGGIWPSIDESPYTCGLTLALFELRD